VINRKPIVHFWPTAEHIDWIELLLGVDVKLFFDGKQHWVTLDYAVTGWWTAFRIVWGTLKMRLNVLEPECA
jgi:hypothetical protein